MAENQTFSTDPLRERYLVVGFNAPIAGNGGLPSLAELVRLVESAEADVTGVCELRPGRVSPRYFVSESRAGQLAALAAEQEANGVVFDCALSPSQQSNLAERLKCKVIDRQAVILDIFAQRAETREGKLQVELAQLTYLLPRLKGFGTALSRLGGGIGTRGPGETMLETDRRVMRERIHRLKADIGQMRKQRAVQRHERMKSEIPVIALIGYTNSGKSTLLNAVSHAEAFVADQLFATLDPKACQLTLPSGAAAVMTDTVGFIHNLPTTLVAAFRATLEEMKFASLLVHLLDASSPNLEREYAATDALLNELELADCPRLVVYNKTDLVTETGGGELLVPDRIPTASISALTGEGVPALLERIEEILSRSYRTLQVLIPFEQSALLGWVKREGQILEHKHLPSGSMLTARCPARLANRLAAYEVAAGEPDEDPQ